MNIRIFFDIYIVDDMDTLDTLDTSTLVNNLTKETDTSTPASTSAQAKHLLL